MLDELLKQYREKPYSRKQCAEELDEHAEKAKAIIAKCKAEGRELIASEARAFDDHVENAKAWKHELTLAAQVDAAILKQSSTYRR